MNSNIEKVKPSGFPPLLSQINDPPKELYIRGEYPDVLCNKFLTVVGSRKYSSYGREVTEHLLEGLRGYDVVIISGLAMGIDTIAHESAIKNGLKTVAVPGSGLGDDVLYPRVNYSLAKRILESGGALVSEFAPEQKATPWSFPQRNRIMAGLSHAVLVIEASEKSGTLITARLANEYNRELMVVPGNIFREGSKGPHLFMKIGATPVTNSGDILQVLGIDGEMKNVGLFENIDLSDDERRVLDVLDESMDRDALVEKSDLPVHRVSIAISSLEMKGFIKESMGEIFRL